jgi:nanoRNase/pAp phosphatase (c-di-AMP/oligoRNAs hydrolase)
VENLVDSAEDAARAADRQNKGRPRAKRLLAALRHRRRILVTCHRHPDPDALGSASGIRYLLEAKLPDLPERLGGGRPTVDMSVRGQLASGINAAFTKHAKLELGDWDDARLLEFGRDDAYDAVVLCDVQPTFTNCPLPIGMAFNAPGRAGGSKGPDVALVVVDHHRTRGRRARGNFVDVRVDVGATASIVFSYFMELDVEVPPDLAATMLYAIESDLAGAAGQPSDLDNAALSALTIRADTKRLYRMRHVSLPQHYFASFANALSDATIFGNVMFAHLGPISSLEKPAVIADMLLRYEGVEWAVVTAVAGDENDQGRPGRLLVSARTSKLDLSAGEAMRRAMRNFGEGGGHRTKAGGMIRLANGTPTEVDRIRLNLRRRMLAALRLPKDLRGRRLIDAECDDEGRPAQPVRFSTP